MKIKSSLLSLLVRRSEGARGRVNQILARFLQDGEGSSLIYFTLLMPIFIGLAGLATEGALLFYNHRSVQSAADAAAYSAAISYSLDNSIANATTQAQAIVAQYGFVVGTGNGQANVVATVDTTTYSPSTAINVSVTRPQLPILSGLWATGFNVTAYAEAIISGGPGGGNGNCMLALAPTGTDIGLQGNPTINAPNCGIFSNSTDACSQNGKNGSIVLGGSASITAGSVGAAGCISSTGSSFVGPPPDAYTSGDNQIIDPYAGTTTPAPGACTYNDTVIKNSPATTLNPQGTILNPGTYCSTNPNKNGALDIQNSTVTLNPGTYIFVGPGQINVDSQSTLTINTALAPRVDPGVTLMFTDPNGTTYPHAQAGGNTPTAVNIQSGATIDLVAPSSGSTQGMLIIGNSNIPFDTAFNLQSNAAGSFSGVVYLPTADFTWGGGPILSGGCTQMISYRLIMSGNAQFNNSNCNLSGGGGGGGGAKPIGNVVTLVY